nr:hypothetical protein [Alteromonas macleodii]
MHKSRFDQSLSFVDLLLPQARKFHVFSRGLSLCYWPEKSYCLLLSLFFGRQPIECLVALAWLGIALSLNYIIKAMD